MPPLSQPEIHCSPSSVLAKPDTRDSLRKKPELLAPAGDNTCLIAAVENGADAVYFGLQRHNARIRAVNFDVAELASTMALLHRRGVRGYVTLNTLLFPGELADMESTIREVATAGVDAVIIQDLGLARLIRAVSPDLEIHASTQMSITSEEGVRLAAELGCSRVILARELSLDEIRKLRTQTEMPLEVFVHGALCVAYSGQCLTSEALGGRSANRGECAQACRMPYEIVCDGETVDLGRTLYLLSPRDLAAYDLIPRLIELGVSSLKIEGRLKTPEYVANITRHYRQAIDAAWDGRPVEFKPRDVEEMQLSFSRGFSHGFLDGSNHKVLVRGDYAKKRGLFLGRVERLTGRGAELRPTTSIKPGDGIVFDGDEGAEVPEQGGRVFEVIAGQAGRVELRLGRDALDLARLHIGQGVWKTDDPELTARLRRTFEGPPERLVGLDFAVRAGVGQPLEITAKAATGHVVCVASPAPLASARSQPADEALLRDQLGRLGGTVYRLGELRATIEGGPMIPRSLLNQLRRDLVARLDEASVRPPRRLLAAEPALPVLLAPIQVERDRWQSDSAARKDVAELSVLCRHTSQIETAGALGIRKIYADFQDIKRYAEAVSAARRCGATIYLATPRIEKPHESNLFRYLARQRADGMLVRNAGGLFFCSERAIPFVADFSLNAANGLTVDLFKNRGAARVTASYDLSASQLLDLIDSVPPDWLEVVVHQQIPMFHMEHCVFCAFLSPGTDKTNCGRPCDHHEVKLRDRVGALHPLKADVGCRNTLFNAVPQTAAEYLPRLLGRGLKHLRIEFLDDDESSVRRVIRLYQDLMEGRRDAKTAWRDLKAASQYGVTRGPLKVL
jgi:putative protease